VVYTRVCLSGGYTQGGLYPGVSLRWVYNSGLYPGVPLGGVYNSGLYPGVPLGVRLTTVVYTRVCLSGRCEKQWFIPGCASQGV